MILIAHRGNLNGAAVERENHPDQIDLCIRSGFEVELDLREKSGALFLGHDLAQYETSLDWLESRKSKIWVHCKDVGALEAVLGSDLNYFWHDRDDHTITSKGHIWSYPGVRLCSKSIAVMPEKWEKDGVSLKCEGICSDFIVKYL